MTSIAVSPGDQSGFFCGTDLCNRYWIEHNNRKVREQVHIVHKSVEVELS